MKKIVFDFISFVFDSSIAAISASDLIKAIERSEYRLEDIILDSKYSSRKISKVVVK